MIGQSQSGTGKTAAFVLTMLSRIKYEREMVQAICLSPTRELARQIVDVAREMGKYTPVKVCLAVKEAGLRHQHVKDHIVVGTPGTMLDILRKKVVDARQVNVFVLDEADNMLDLQGLGEQSMRVKKFVSLISTNSRFIPKAAQMLLFSATFPSDVHIFAKRFAPNANEITLRLEELSVEGIKQLYMDCRDERHKYEVLVGLYGLMNIGQSIIFVAVISPEMALIAETRYCRCNR
jgi:ATP-dependent RNA helicase DDX19/DBP5